jgi:hypothetical protein
VPKSPHPKKRSSTAGFAVAVEQRLNSSNANSTRLRPDLPESSKSNQLI